MRVHMSRDSEERDCFGWWYTGGSYVGVCVPCPAGTYFGSTGALAAAGAPVLVLAGD